MALRPWQKLSESTRAKNPWWSYKCDAFRLPSGKEGEYHYVHTNGSSMIVPVMGDGSIILVNQYRYLLAKESLEFPCGSVKEGSTHDETAWHELAEETGYSAGHLLCAGTFNPYNGVTDEMCNVYIAKELRFVGGSPDETEEFEVLHLFPDEIEARIHSGSIWDGMTIAGWVIVKGKLEKA